MHRNIVLTFGILTYFVVATIALSVFGASLLASGIILFGFPTLFLARYSAAPQSVIMTVTAFGAGLALMLETVGHFYGLWYIQSVPVLRLFGVVPLEVILVTFLKVLFVVLLYEMLFDDGQYSRSNARTRFVSFGLFAVAALFLLAAHYFVFQSVYEPTAYYWLSAILLLTSFAMVAVGRTLTLPLFDKVVNFAAVAAVPLLCADFLAAANGYKQFMNILNPIMVPFTQVTLPLGEILLTLSIPIFVTTVYELYLDDRS